MCIFDECSKIDKSFFALLNQMAMNWTVGDTPVKLILDPDDDNIDGNIYRFGPFEQVADLNEAMSIDLTTHTNSNTSSALTVPECATHAQVGFRVAANGVLDAGTQQTARVLIGDAIVAATSFPRTEDVIAGELQLDIDTGYAEIPLSGNSINFDILYKNPKNSSLVFVEGWIYGYTRKNYL